MSRLSNGEVMATWLCSAARITTVRHRQLRLPRTNRSTGHDPSLASVSCQPGRGPPMTTGPADASPALPALTPALPRRPPGQAVMLRLLPGTAGSVAAARELTRELLGPGHPALDTAMLVVSELVTNSVTHSRSGLPGGTVIIAVTAGAAGVLIQVRDEGGLTEPRVVAPQAAAGAEHGYGLLLVSALADTWGTTTTREGRLTWCRVGASEPPG
jgi:anti-sigma regulatory factor (Ser/Thr protein kinase)